MDLRLSEKLMPEPSGCYVPFPQHELPCPSPRKAVLIKTLCCQTDSGCCDNLIQDGLIKQGQGAGGCRVAV